MPILGGFGAWLASLGQVISQGLPGVRCSPRFSEAVGQLALRGLQLGEMGGFLTLMTTWGKGLVTVLCDRQSDGCGVIPGHISGGQNMDARMPFRVLEGHSANVPVGYFLGERSL